MESKYFTHVALQKEALRVIRLWKGNVDGISKSSKITVLEEIPHLNTHQPSIKISN